MNAAAAATIEIRHHYFTIYFTSNIVQTLSHQWPHTHIEFIDTATQRHSLLNETNLFNLFSIN